MFDFDVRSGSEGLERELAAGVRRLPTHDEKLLAKFLDPFLDEFSEPISAIPTQHAVVVAPSCSLRSALLAMAERHVGVAVVASHGVLMGLLTERELAHALLQTRPEAVTDIAVWKVMNAKPDTLLESDSVGYAVSKICTLGGGAMAVLNENGTPSGVLQTHDVLTWMWGRVGGTFRAPRHLNFTDLLE